MPISCTVDIRAVPATHFPRALTHRPARESMRVGTRTRPLRRSSAARAVPIIVPHVREERPHASQ
jgi:hypothetical protein